MVSLRIEAHTENALPTSSIIPKEMDKEKRLVFGSQGTTLAADLARVARSTDKSTSRANQIHL